MSKVNILRSYGLFEAKVPRYTSYPPANRFSPDVGARVQRDWIAGLPGDQPVSLYVHIPFCRRLCWFCACRTQGTKTLAPVEAYVTDVIEEISTVSALLPTGLKMGRLHLGGGTPTLVQPAILKRLLDAIFGRFAKTGDFEFSVEIDPTEAASDVLDVLTSFQMNRASVGVQDFNPRVQEAIGREQSFEQTRSVIELLRQGGVKSLNVDMLYGLPYQDSESLDRTLDQVMSLEPDRLALYGYAHVPHMSKRQVMIPDDALPSSEARFTLAEAARDRLVAAGYVACGIDHFARAEDGLAKAAKAKRLRRNFQGYTDDPCASLIGFGASAISRYPQGYVQNAVATGAYRQRIESSGLAAHRGYIMSDEDVLISDIIEAFMCQGGLDIDDFIRRHKAQAGRILIMLDDLKAAYPLALNTNDGRLSLRDGMDAAARLIAARLDQQIEAHHVHSLAV